MFTKKKKKTMRKTLFKIKLIYFIKFFADALYTPFLILFLKSIGYDGLKLGVLMGIVPLFTIIGNIVLSLIANEFKKNKIILSILLFLYGTGLLLLIFTAKDFILAIISIVLISFSNCPSFNLEEGLTSIYIEKANKNYSFTRIFGSLGYFIALSVLFFLPTNIEFQSIFLISSAFMFILSIVWIFLPNLSFEKNKKSSLSSLIKNKEFLMYFLMYFLFFGAFSAFDYYIPDFVSANNYSKNDYSLFYALAVLLEALVIVVVGKIAKEKDYYKFLIFALFVLLMRSLLFSMPFLNRVFIPILLISRGIGWGTFLAIHIKILMTILNSLLKGTGILVLCVGQGIVASLLNFIGSNVIKYYSYNAFFMMIVCCMVISFVFYLVYNLFWRKRRYENKNQ